VKIIKRVTNEGISLIDDSGSQGYVDLSNVTKTGYNIGKKRKLSEERVIELRKRSNVLVRGYLCKASVYWVFY